MFTFDCLSLTVNRGSGSLCDMGCEILIQFWSICYSPLEDQNRSLLKNFVRSQTTSLLRQQCSYSLVLVVLKHVLSKITMKKTFTLTLRLYSNLNPSAHAPFLEH
ncbi:hypothetical protein AVEN_191966-1 [Araneus ventricosus]|uniref:Uncharacterized protein n=1 Tax=Araneus ventricosus TaxID=182803 RepID=A0A4Y2L9I7_ARAVE|nr:hypothetical protein AVEN_191966-1 [Araneus ventricosus]